MESPEPAKQKTGNKKGRPLGFSPVKSASGQIIVEAEGEFIIIKVPKKIGLKALCGELI